MVTEIACIDCEGHGTRALRVSGRLMSRDGVTELATIYKPRQCASCQGLGYHEVWSYRDLIGWAAFFMAFATLFLIFV